MPLLVSKYRHLLTIVAVIFFFFNDTATTEIYTLSLHDALPISSRSSAGRSPSPWRSAPWRARSTPCTRDRKSTRLNSSHVEISYAVFCLKKKKRIRVFGGGGSHERTDST